MRGKNLFTGLIPVKGFFVFDVAPTREVEEPFRECKYSLIVHCWPRKAIVLGKWGSEAPEGHETRKILSALSGREVGDIEKQQEEKEYRSQADRGNLVHANIQNGM